MLLRSIALAITLASGVHVADAQALRIHTTGGGVFEYSLSAIDSITFSYSQYLYFEDFTNSAEGWHKIAGPGFLGVNNGVFAHTPPGFSVWCEYAYTGRVFGNARYEADVFVDSLTQSTQYAWRAPDTTQLAGNGGAYVARFNNSDIAPGGLGHFVLEKLDPQGRTILLEIPNRFVGLNHLEVIDTGTMLQVVINGTSYGSINVGSLTPAQPGYIFVVGGDRGNGDYFDNVSVR